MTDVLIPKRDGGSDYNLRLVDKTTYHAPVSVVVFEDVLVDEQTNALKTIDTVHHEVHEGEMWHTGHTVASVANGNSMDLLFHSGGAYDCHMTFEVFAGGQVSVYLYEAPTVAAEGDGTPLVIYNMKRSHVGASHSQAYHTPTISATGTTALVNGRILPGGTSAQTRVGGGIRQGVEWILNPGTNYLLRTTNTSGSAIAVNVGLEWYEEEVVV